MYYAYILRFLEDGSYYTGVTNNIRRRIHEHRTCADPGSYVSRKGAFEVVRIEQFQYIMDAIHREKQIQAWSKVKKDALVSGYDDALQKLAKKQFSRVMPRYNPAERDHSA